MILYYNSKGEIIMKQLAILFLSLIIYISIADAKQKKNNTSVKHLIQKVKNSTGDDRRVAMNALKVKLRSMNQETRQHVMRDLQKSFTNTQHSMQRGMQNSGSRTTMNQGNAKGIHSSGSSGGMHANPSRTPAHASPTSAPHQPAPSAPQVPHGQPPSPHVPAPQMPTPQMPIPKMPSPGTTSPHFGQPGGHR